MHRTVEQVVGRSNGFAKRCQIPTILCRILTAVVLDLVTSHRGRSQGFAQVAVVGDVQVIVEEHQVVGGQTHVTVGEEVGTNPTIRQAWVVFVPLQRVDVATSDQVNVQSFDGEEA